IFRGRGRIVARLLRLLARREVGDGLVEGGDLLRRHLARSGGGFRRGGLLSRSGSILRLCGRGQRQRRGKGRQGDINRTGQNQLSIFVQLFRVGATNAFNRDNERNGRPVPSPSGSCQRAKGAVRGKLLAAAGGAGSGFGVLAPLLGLPAFVDLRGGPYRVRRIAA